MKIFVLNLERAVERRQSMLQHLSGLGIEAEILPAVEGARLPPSSLPAGTDPRLSPGEVGCYLSHVRFWEIVVERGLEHAIVLEDDVRCSPAMLQVVADIVALGLPLDAVRLSALNPIRGQDITTLAGGTKLVLPNKNPSGTQGYMVTLEGARRLLQRLAVPRCPTGRSCCRACRGPSRRTGSRRLAPAVPRRRTGGGPARRPSSARRPRPTPRRRGRSGPTR